MVNRSHKHSPVEYHDHDCNTNYNKNLALLNNVIT